jgi:hypothetical protein
VFNRDNVIGSVLLLLCAAVGVVLLYSIATGTRFRWEGPAWVGTALVIFFIGATIWGFVMRPGRRWPWEKWRDRDRRDGDGESGL